MKVTVDINIENARSVLYISSGSFEQSEIISMVRFRVQGK